MRTRQMLSIIRLVAWKQNIAIQQAVTSYICTNYICSYNFDVLYTYSVLITFILVGGLNSVISILP